MRLTERQQQAICSGVQRWFGVCARVWLFGSRVDDDRRGGDIDLYIEPEEADASKLVDARIHFLMTLHRQIGEQRVDVVLRRPGSGMELPIYRIAKTDGLRLL